MLRRYFLAVGTAVAAFIASPSLAAVPLGLGKHFYRGIEYEMKLSGPGSGGTIDPFEEWCMLHYKFWAGGHKYGNYVPIQVPLDDDYEYTLASMHESARLNIDKVLV